MAHYIDKSALVAEIERLRTLTQEQVCGCLTSDYKGGINKMAELILSFLDTLEVKEVDFENEQRMKECPYRQVGCTMYEGHILECRGACSWVVDYPKLKELKARKGE